MSKGDRQRPTKDQKRFDENWDKIFNKNKKSDKNCHKKNKKIGTEYA
jgi:hypothetical protein